MVWATRQFGIDDWFHVQSHFAKQFMDLDGPRDMLLLSTDVSVMRTRLYVGLPERSLLASYEGFDEVAEADLPKQALLLVGDSIAFREKFEFPKP